MYEKFVLDTYHGSAVIECLHLWLFSLSSSFAVWLSLDELAELIALHVIQ